VKLVLLATITPNRNKISSKKYVYIFTRGFVKLLHRNILESAQHPRILVLQSSGNDAMLCLSFSFLYNQWFYANHVNCAEE